MDVHIKDYKPGTYTVLEVKEPIILWGTSYNYDNPDGCIVTFTCFIPTTEKGKKYCEDYFPSEWHSDQD